MPAVRFAAGIPGTSEFATTREACRLAETAGFDVWVAPDHLLAEGVLGAPGAPVLECFTTIAALVPATSRLRFLSLVACNSFRNPALLAKIVASLDVVSGGRIELGIGAGWLRREHEAYGYDFPPAAIRLEQLREAIGVVKSLWSGAPVDHEGKHYRLRNAVCAPRPVQRPRPPILVGGGGAGLLAVAAREADIVNIVPPAGDGAADPDNVRRFTLSRFRTRAARVRTLAEASGRDPAALTLSAIFFVRLVETDSEARTVLQGVAARYGLPPADAERFPLMLIGTAARLQEQLAERIALLDLGYVVLNFASPVALEQFGAEVLPAFNRGC